MIIIMDIIEQNERIKNNKVININIITRGARGVKAISTKKAERRIKKKEDDQLVPLPSPLSIPN